MNKVALLAITVGGLVFAGSLDGSSSINKIIEDTQNKFCLAEDTIKDEVKLERRRRGKQQKGRKRGGAGLR